MKAHSLTLENGHPFVTLPEGAFLLDTGAPTSFGRAPLLTLGSRAFNLPTSYMGLTALVLSGYVGRETQGILGTDILNQFDVLIDLPQACLGISTEPLECDGDVVPLDFCMGAPIVDATVSGTPRKMFFDTGAQISYLQDDGLVDFPAEGSLTDFYPGIGSFSTDTFRVPVRLGRMDCPVRCGQLPALLGITLLLAGTAGILGNEILRTRRAGYFPRRKRIVFS